MPIKDQNELGQKVSFPMEQKYFDTSDASIRAEQRARDAYCILQIEKAFSEGLLLDGDKFIDENDPQQKASEEAVRIFIDEDAKKLLEFYYSDGMDIYTEMTTAFNQVFENDKEFKVVDRDSWDVIKDKAQPKDITPNSCVQVFIFKKHPEKPGGREVQAVLTYPGLKNVNRAILKLSTTGKYATEYKRKKLELRRRFRDDEQTYQKEVAKLLKPVDLMGDILRISLSLENYATLVRWKDKAIASKAFKVNPNRIKDKFCNNDVRLADQFNEKNFRNLVLYLQIGNNKVVEVQLKIRDLELVDKLTHPFYEQLRLKKEKLKKLELDLEEKSGGSNNIVALNTGSELTKLRRDVKRLEMTIQTINRYGIEKHNQNKILSKAVKIEQKLRDAGISPHPDGTYPEVSEWLEKNFLARPLQDLREDAPLLNLPAKIKKMYLAYRRGKKHQVPTEAEAGYAKMFDFYTKNPELQQLFKDFKPGQLEVFNRYKKILAPKYRCVIKDVEKTAFLMQKRQLVNS